MHTSLPLRIPFPTDFIAQSPCFRKSSLWQRSGHRMPHFSSYSSRKQ